MTTRSLNVNGFPVEARYDDAAMEGILLPLLRALSARAAQARRRVVTFIAAPPGAGKSTLAAFLEALSREAEGCLPAQALGLDGFHYPNEYLARHFIPQGGASVPLSEIKGAPETFDTAALAAALGRAREGEALWPYYDRRLHEPVPDAIPVAAEVLLVEGNWLLLDRPPWRTLPRDMSVFIGADEPELRERLIARKIRGGLSPEAARDFYARSDGPNVRLCLAHSLPADLRLRLSRGRLSADQRAYMPPV